MRFIPVRKVGLGAWNFGSMNFDFSTDFSNTDFSKIDWSAAFDDEKRAEAEQRAKEMNDSFLGYPSVVPSTEKLLEGQYNALLQLVEQIKSTGTQFEKDYHLPKYQEQLECYKNHNDTDSKQLCLAQVGNKHSQIIRSVINEAGLRHESEFSKVYNEKAAEQNKQNKKLLVIGGIVVGTVIIGTTIILSNR